MKHLLILSSLLFVSSHCFAQLIEEAPPAPEPVYEIGEEVPEPPGIDRSFSDGLHPFKEGELLGLKDYATGEILLEAKYDLLKSENPGYFQLRENSKWGIYSEKERKLVIPVENDFVMPYKRQLPSGEKCVFFEVIKSYAYPSKGILDNNYNVVVPTQYDQIDYFPNFLRLRLGGNWGVFFYDREKQDIPVVYNSVQVSGEDNFSVRKDKLFQLFDKNGKQLFGEQKLITDFYGRWEERTKEHLLISDSEGKMGIFHLENNQMLLPQEYDRILDRFNNLYIVEKNGKWGIVDPNNKVIVPLKYEAISFLKPMNLIDQKGERDTSQDAQTLISVKKKGKYGLINRQGKAISNIEFDEVEHLYGFYAAKKSGKYAVLNSSGEPICQETFDLVGHFHKGKATVFNQGKKFYLNSDGSVTATISKIAAPTGFKDIDTMYEALVEALKSDDDTKLRKFAAAVVPDAHSLDFMNRSNLHYRGFPDRINEQQVSIETLVESCFIQFVTLRERLKSKNELASLEFVGYKYPLTGIGYQYVSQPVLLLAIENYGTIKTGPYEFEYKMGELLNIDGYWKSFTQPRSH